MSQGSLRGSTVTPSSTSSAGFTVVLRPSQMANKELVEVFRSDLNLRIVRQRLTPTDPLADDCMSALKLVGFAVLVGVVGFLAAVLI